MVAPAGTVGKVDLGIFVAVEAAMVGSVAVEVCDTEGMLNGDIGGVLDAGLVGRFEDGVGRVTLAGLLGISVTEEDWLRRARESARDLWAVSLSTPLANPTAFTKASSAPCKLSILLSVSPFCCHACQCVGSNWIAASASCSARSNRGGVDNE